jgi:hypothetical protein
VQPLSAPAMAPMEKSGAARTGVVLIAVAANLLDHRGVRRRFANCRPVYRRRRDRGYAEKSDCSRQQHRQNHNTHFLFLSCRATDAASVNTVDWLVRRYAATLSATPQHSQLRCNTLSYAATPSAGSTRPGRHSDRGGRVSRSNRKECR